MNSIVRGRSFCNLGCIDWCNQYQTGKIMFLFKQSYGIMIINPFGKHWIFSSGFQITLVSSLLTKVYNLLPSSQTSLRRRPMWVTPYSTQRDESSPHKYLFVEHGVTLTRRSKRIPLVSDRLTVLSVVVVRITTHVGTG